MSAPILIDCDYVAPQLAAAYLLVEGREAAFVETNTTHAVPRLLQALSQQGLSPADVRYVIITHVHLDHAGGASALMRACPGATLLAHPRAAPHVIRPAKLVASARQVYGDELFAQLYGELQPLPEERVRVMQDEERLSWGSRTLRFLFTRGHANHHFCIQDSGSGGIFTGDSFGLAYPALQQQGLFIFPSTSPTDFDPVEARASVRKILESGARSAYLTHFGEVTELEAAAAQLLEHLDVCEGLLRRTIEHPGPDEQLSAFCERELHAWFARVIERQGIPMDARRWEFLRLDIELNAQGIAFAARRHRLASAPGDVQGRSPRT